MVFNKIHKSAIDYTECWANTDHDGNISGIYIRKIGCTNNNFVLGFLDRYQKEIELRHFTSQSEAEECLELFLKSFQRMSKLGY